MSFSNARLYASQDGALSAAVLFDSNDKATWASLFGYYSAGDDDVALSFVHAGAVDAQGVCALTAPDRGLKEGRFPQPPKSRVASGDATLRFVGGITTLELDYVINLAAGHGIQPSPPRPAEVGKIVLYQVTD